MPRKIASYEAAIDFLYGRINYERVDAQAYSTSDFKLDRMRTLLSLIGNPQLRIPAVHIAGTKGKGSTCTMVAAVLAASSLRAGLYISPHITSFEERMTVNGVQPSRSELVELVNRLIPVVAEMDSFPGQMQPTYFELATAIAWLFFVDQHVDIAVLETGLGGRLDSTNICQPVVCAITNISRDHTHILGSTIAQITWEKAGIIKSGVPIVSGVRQPEAVKQIEQICRERTAPLILLGRDVHLMDRRSVIDVPMDGNRDSSSDSSPARLPVSRVNIKTGRGEWIDVPVVLRGAHQASNTALALAVVDELRAQGWQISPDQVRRGLLDVRWPARVEVVANFPTVVVDAAHNWESARALLATLREDFRPRRRILIFAATRDKDVAGLLRQMLPEFDTVILTRYLDNPRGVPVAEMSDFIRSVSNRTFHIADSPAAAWELAMGWADRDDLIAITGSFFLVAELRDEVIRTYGGAGQSAAVKN